MHWLRRLRSERRKPIERVRSFFISELANIQAEFCADIEILFDCVTDSLGGLRLIDGPGPVRTLVNGGLHEYITTDAIDKLSFDGPAWQRVVRFLQRYQANPGVTRTQPQRKPTN